MSTREQQSWKRFGLSVRDLLPDRATLVSLRRDPRRDLIAGITVAIVALPLALGFGISSGAGASAGLATAVIAGTIAAIFGGSNLQVSGPTGAMTVVLVPIIHRYGMPGVLTVGLLAGILLVGLALAKAGDLMAYVPVPVVEGFTIGIAAVIALQQVPAALGLKSPPGDNPAAVAWKALREFMTHAGGWPALVITVAVAAAMLAGAKWLPSVPFSLIGVVGATILVRLVHLPVPVIGGIPAGLQAPSLGFVDLANVPGLLPSALAVAALGALESLMSATAADAMSVSDRHDSNRELFGQGLANVVAPVFGGVAATGAIARTAVNVRAGGVSRLAAIVHALILAVIVFAAAPLVGGIPVAALAGVLIATAIRMVEYTSIAALARSGRGEAFVMAVTAAATLAFNLVTAVIAGLILAGALALRQLSRAAQVRTVGLHEGLTPADHHREERELLAQHIVAYRLDGPLLFATAHRFLLELADMAAVRVMILRLSRISAVDATGARLLSDTITKLSRRGTVVLVSGLSDDHRALLDTLGALDMLAAQGRVFDSTPAAIAYAKNLLQRDGTIKVAQS